MKKYSITSKCPALQTLRKDIGLTQKQLASMLGIAHNTVGMYEQGRRAPDLEAVVKLAEIFTVSTDYLLGHGTKTEEVANTPPPAEIPEKEEIWGLYEQLDAGDRGEIRGGIKMMLRAEKYALNASERRA